MRDYMTMLLGFVRALRAGRAPVSLVEALDAVAALEHIDLSRPEPLKMALRATVVKRPEHQATFERLFERYFAPYPAAAQATDLLADLAAAQQTGDSARIRSLAQQAADGLAGFGSQPGRTERYYLQRVLRGLDLMRLLQAGWRRESELAARLEHQQRLRQVDELRQALAEAVARRMTPANTEPDIKDVDFLGASPEELKQMRAAVRPLAHKLAARIRHRRRYRRQGRLDLRRTMRRSLSTGGVPLQPAFRRPRASHSELCLLCDVSGSVAEFAAFTLALLHALNEELPHLRSFVFVDGIAEVTALFAGGAQPRPGQLLQRPGLLVADGRSDYGRVFSCFWENWREVVRPKTTVIITGDGRNNFRPSRPEALRAIAGRAQRVYWLNPLPRPEWHEHDSVLSHYAQACTAVVEARNLRQLGAFVAAVY